MNALKTFLKNNWPMILMYGGGALLLYWIYKKFFATQANGGSGISNAVGTAAGDFVGSDLGSALFGTQSAAELQATGNSLDAQLSTMNQNDYAPGGRIYNEVAATKGTAAADQNWTTVQAHEKSGATGNVQDSLNQAAQSGSAGVWSSLFGWL